MHYGYGYFEEDRLKKSGDLKLWRRIMIYVAPRWLEVSGAIILALVITGCSLALPDLIRRAIDDFIVNSQLDSAARLAGVSDLALIFLVLLVTGFAAHFLQVIILEWTGQQIMHRMRQDLFSHMLSLETAFFNRNPVGKLVTRLTNDIQNMHEMFTSVIVTLFNDMVRIAGILVILCLMNWRLALLMMLLIPVIIFNTVLFSRLARLAFREIRTQLARINAFLQEALSGISVIQLFARERDTLRRFGELNESFLQRCFYQIKIFGLFMPMLELLSAVAVALIIWYGGGQIIRERMSMGELVAFLTYMRLFFQPLRDLSQKYSIVQSSLASAERIFQLLDTVGNLPVAAEPKRAAAIRGGIEFDRVTFGYGKAQPVVKELTFRAEPGETVAIVGATGAGKTTIINLLERFYDPDRGRIRLDGIDLQDLAPEDLRQQIGLVMQDVYIFPATFRENIVMDRAISAQRLNEIIAAAQLSGFIRNLPAGLETRIGEGGQDLSAGQRQLLAMARVLSRDSRILVLDEATSSVDTETEMLIEKALAATMANRTSIIIAHRLSTIRRADRIIVMDRGRIVEEGDHEALMAENGVYHRLISLQNGKNGDG
ncbi:MAG: ABC transporter ATP-binding protein [Desulfurivibrionaceae bacterium]|nr:ABC transporter ATP-binding protein [Desulfurivibrionaceae bacterium]